jgi:hypothetical protein
LFVAIGVSAGWIIAPRFFFALLIVWSIRAINAYRDSKNAK